MTGGLFSTVVVVTGMVVVGVGVTVVVVTGSVVVVVECFGVVVGVGDVVGVPDVDETSLTDDPVRDVVAT